MNTPELNSLLDVSIKELTEVRSTLLARISQFAELDPIYLLVRREQKCDVNDQNQVSPDVFSFATQCKDEHGMLQIDLVSMPYASLLDNFVIFDSLQNAQTACDVLNNENHTITLVPRTPSMIFYEQLSEVDRVLEKITTSTAA